MLTPVANVHHHKLPRPGALVSLDRLNRNTMHGVRYIVVAYPLSDSPDQRNARGIHTVYLQRLGGDYGCKPLQVAGHWCDEIDS